MSRSTYCQFYNWYSRIAQCTCGRISLDENSAGGGGLKSGGKEASTCIRRERLRPPTHPLCNFTLFDEVSANKRMMLLVKNWWGMMMMARVGRHDSYAHLSNDCSYGDNVGVNTL